MTEKDSELRPWHPELERAADEAFMAPRKRRVRWGYVLTAAGWLLLALAAAALGRYAPGYVLLLSAAGVACVFTGSVSFVGTGAKASYLYLVGILGMPPFVIGTVSKAFDHDLITQKCRVAEVKLIREYPTDLYPEWRYRVECPSGPREIVETIDVEDVPEGPAHIPGETVGVSWRPGDRHPAFYYGSLVIPYAIGLVALAAMSLSAMLFGQYRKPPRRASLPDESKPPQPPQQRAERPMPPPAWGWPAVVLGCGTAVSGAAVYVFVGMPQPLTKNSSHLVSRRWQMRAQAMAVKARKCSALRS